MISLSFVIAKKTCYLPLNVQKRVYGSLGRIDNFRQGGGGLIQMWEVIRDHSWEREKWVSMLHDVEENFKMVFWLVLNFFCPYERTLFIYVNIHIFCMKAHLWTLLYHKPANWCMNGRVQREFRLQRGATNVH